MKIVLCHGNFDPLHIGHIRHLESARRLGDVLIVSAAPDLICKIKGGDRPYFTAAERVEALNALKCVTFAFVSESIPAIRMLKPHVYAKGPECRTNPTPGHEDEIVVVKSYGGEVVYTDDQVFSSTELMRKVLSHG